MERGGTFGPGFHSSKWDRTDGGASFRRNAIPSRFEGQWSQSGALNTTTLPKPRRFDQQSEKPFLANFQAVGGRQHVYTDGSRRGFFDDDVLAAPSTSRKSVHFRDVNGLASPEEPEELAPRFVIHSRPKLVRTDMTRKLLDYIVQTAYASVDRYEDDIDISRCMKLKLESRYSGCWMVVVGDSYATFVTEDCYQAGTFAYFFINKQGFLVFKCF